MSTFLSPIRPPSINTGPGRIVERTTTITREIFFDDPMPDRAGASSHPHSRPEPSGETISASSSADTDIRGFDRALVRAGVWLIELGRRHSLRPTRSADEIARRVEEARAHNMRHFIGRPC